MAVTATIADDRRRGLNSCDPSLSPLLVAYNQSMLRTGVGSLQNPRAHITMSIYSRCFPSHAVSTIFSLLAFSIVSGPCLTRAAEQPNVIVVLTDNHGAWTLGCYGNPEIRTPNIDRLAAEGTLFSHAFASNPVCSPTRATLLTGLLPSQHGVHCFLRGGRLQVGPEARNTLQDFRSMGEVFHDAGYRCGLVGKWHLGGNLTPQEGLDDEWVTMPHGGTSTFYDAPIIEDGKQQKAAEYLTDFWTNRSVEFIKESAQKEKPFFLYLAYNGPYALGRLLLRESQNRHAEYYRGVDFQSFPREGIHPWQYNNLDYLHNPVSERRVAAEVSAVDDGVGTILQTLEDLNLQDDTLIVFLADQGWVGGHGGFIGMGDHTRPVTARDGMMQIPMIWWQPGKVKGGQTAKLMVANYDVLPTMLSHLNLSLGELPPGHPKSPGRDFSASFADATAKSSGEVADWTDEIFYEFESLRCIRTRRWKYIHRHPYGPHEMYDLEADPNEQKNLSDSITVENERTKLRGRLTEFYDDFASPKYDLWKGGGSQTVLFVDAVEPPREELPVAAAKWEKDFTAANLTVPEGLEVQLAAAPPLVRHPLMGCFDDQGRLYLAESAGLNLRPDDLEEQLPNFVRRLEDVDGDGVYDKSTMFADKMTFPQGALWHDGALYVAAPPNIWRLEDTDDDGVADKREVLVDHFGYNGNGASVHGCFLSPDGRIYWCDGRHGHEFQDEQGNVVQKREGSYIFSCRPDGSDVQVHCGGGMDNPVEVDFTDAGEVIGTVNILKSRPREDCLVHWQFGGTYPHSERVLGEFKRTGDLLGPIHSFGHVAVSGTTRYRSGWLDAGAIDNFFVTIFNTGKVQRVELEREGSSYRAIEREFLTSLSKDFHPTDVLEDADGSLLVIDTGGWFRIGCPASQIAKPEIPGGIYRIKRKGSPSFLDPWGKNIPWSSLSHANLGKLLNDTRFKVRERAIAEFSRRGDDAIPTLTSVITRSDIRSRLGAVWALARIETPAAQRSTHAAFADRKADVRAAAAVSSGSTGDVSAANGLIQLLADEAPSVRRAAATALGKIGVQLNDQAKGVGAILQNLRAPADRAEEHALIYALIQMDQPLLLERALQSPHATVVRGALWALDQMDSSPLLVSHVAPLLTSTSPIVREAAQQVFVGHTDWSQSVGPILKEWLAMEEGHQGRQELVHGFVIAFASDPGVAQLIGDELQNGRPNTKQLILSALAAANSLPLAESWSQPLIESLKSQKVDELQLAISAAASIHSDRFKVAFAGIAGEESLPTSLRISATEAILRQTPRPSSETFDFLISLLGETSSPQERVTAARVLSNASLTPKQLRRVAPNLAAAGPLELRMLIQPFRRHVDDETSRLFLAALARSRSFSSLAVNELSDVVKGYPENLLDECNALLEQLRKLDEEKRQLLDKLVGETRLGNAARGKEIFFSTKSKCSTCHRIGTEGGQIGPNLSAIGKIRREKDLLEAVIFPSASLVREFEPYTVILNDGRILAGIVMQETTETLHIQQAEGKPFVIHRGDIESVIPSTISIMPQGLHKELTEQQLSDLVSFLRSQNGE